MTALSRKLKRIYINRLFDDIVGSCQRESSLNSLILMATFVTGLGKGRVITWGANKQPAPCTVTQRLDYYITMNQKLAVCVN